MGEGTKLEIALGSRVYVKGEGGAMVGVEHDWHYWTAGGACE